MSAPLRFLSTVNDLERIVDSRATWESKYDLCFEYKGGIYKQLLRTGIELVGYVDPDTSYQDRVMALYYAAKETAKRVEIEIGHTGSGRTK